MKCPFMRVGAMICSRTNGPTPFTPQRTTKRKDNLIRRSEKLWTSVVWRTPALQVRLQSEVIWAKKKVKMYLKSLKFMFFSAFFVTRGAGLREKSSIFPQYCAPSNVISNKRKLSCFDNYQGRWSIHIQNKFSESIISAACRLEDWECSSSSS